MTFSVWKDASSHSQKSTDRTPNKYVCNLYCLRLKVYREWTPGEGYSKHWVGDCDPFVIGIEGKTAKIAMKNLVMAVQQKLIIHTNEAMELLKKGNPIEK